MHGLGGKSPRPGLWNSKRTKLAAGATAGALAVSAGVYHQRKSSHRAASQPQQQAPTSAHALALPTPSIRLPASLVEAIAGAIGEVVQVAFLYPLDTIKVRCQANGMMSTEVVKDLVARSASRPASLVSSLYAGVGGATLCSIIIGAVHFSSYETSKRCMFERLPELIAPLQQVLPAVAAPLAGSRSSSKQSSASSSGSSQQQRQLEQQQQQDRVRSHAGASSSGSGSSGCGSEGTNSSRGSESSTAHGQAATGANRTDSSSNSSNSSDNRRGRRSRRGHSRAEGDGSQGTSHDSSHQQQQQHPHQQQQQQDQSSSAHHPSAASTSTSHQQPPPPQPPPHTGAHSHPPGQPHQEGQQHQGAPASATAGEQGDSQQPPEQPHHHHLHLLDDAPSFKAGDKLGVNIVASIITAIATALVESPVELFRHNQQAGTVEGNFMREMLSTVRKKGPMGLYWGFLPHCFEALPHDISEMLVMGCMKDMHIDAMTLNTKPHHRFIRSIPVEAWDLTAGAASGVAAVLVSMPFDCIKTYMQTRGTNVSGQGVLGTANMFFRTGRDMVAHKGPGCLYYGVVPRLLQQVPSSMMCWWAVHAVVRALQPWTIKEATKDDKAGEGDSTKR